MSRLIVRSFSISIDGYGAGPGQDLQNPLGVGGPELFDWFFHTRTWQRMHGKADGETGVDDDLAAQGFEGIGACVLSRRLDTFSRRSKPKRRIKRKTKQGLHPPLSSVSAFSACC